MDADPDQLAAAGAGLDAEPRLAVVLALQPRLVGDEVHLGAVDLAELPGLDEPARLAHRGVRAVGERHHQVAVLRLGLARRASRSPPPSCRRASRRRRGSPPPGRRRWPPGPRPPPGSRRPGAARTPSASTRGPCTPCGTWPPAPCGRRPRSCRWGRPGPPTPPPRSSPASRNSPAGARRPVCVMTAALIVFGMSGPPGRCGPSYRFARGPAISDRSSRSADRVPPRVPRADPPVLGVIQAPCGVRSQARPSPIPGGSRLADARTAGRPAC